MFRRLMFLSCAIFLSSCASIRDKEPLHFALYDNNFMKLKTLLDRPEHAEVVKGILYSAVMPY